jgi:hypothetical protein
MERQLSNAIQVYNEETDDRPQCYHSSHAVHKALIGDGVVDMVLTEEPKLTKASLKLLYKMSPGTHTVELKIIADGCFDAKKIRSKYGMSRFFVPRLFIHSFLIVISDRVYISQSWFGVMNMKIIYKLTNNQFKKWLDKLRENVNKFSSKPWALFDQFQYPSKKRGIGGLMDFIRADVDNTVVKLELHSTVEDEEKSD